MGMRKVNTIGIRQANKVMLMAGAADNLKKLLKYTHKKVKTGVKVRLSTFAKIIALVPSQKPF
jgi:hypothetical protein